MKKSLILNYTSLRPFGSDKPVNPNDVFELFRGRYYTSEEIRVLKKYLLYYSTDESLSKVREYLVGNNENLFGTILGFKKDGEKIIKINLKNRVTKITYEL